jgi:hypothetical protein
VVGLGRHQADAVCRYRVRHKVQVFKFGGKV